jgi:hypothetical protein
VLEEQRRDETTGEESRYEPWTKTLRNRTLVSKMELPTPPLRERKEGRVTED